MGWEDAIQKFRPILNQANVDLLISGHTHRFFYHDSGSDGNTFPVLEQGGVCATRLDLHNGIIQLKVIDTAGKILTSKTLKR